MPEHPFPPEWASDSTRWPSVDAAFALVAPSYQWLIARTEAADARLGSLTTASAALLFGVPTLGRALDPTLRPSLVLYLSLACILCSAVLSLLARVHGHLQLCDPAKVYEKGLGETDWLFKKNTIYFAGEHFRHNRRTVAVKSAAAAVAGWLLVAGAGLASLWFVA